jgi:transcriptional regulator with XRE-family HTH domain
MRERREALRKDDPEYSLRRVAERVGVEPSYLSKVERDIGSPPSEPTLVRIAAALEIDPDVLLALAGKVSSDLQEAIRRRPALFAELIRELKDAPDQAVLRLVREVRDGDW